MPGITLKFIKVYQYSYLDRFCTNHWLFTLSNDLPFTGLSLGRSIPKCDLFRLLKKNINKLTFPTPECQNEGANCILFNISLFYNFFHIKGFQLFIEKKPNTLMCE
jgi:hypothetical protein